MTKFSRELSVAAAIAALAVWLAFAAPGYFSAGNLADLFLANVPVLVISVGATLVIVTGEIDISVGSVFAIAGVVGGVAAKLAPSAAAPWAALAAGCAAGALAGFVNGALVAIAGMPSIVVTLATMVAFRDALRWTTQGEWVENLPAQFRWFGLTQTAYPVLLLIVVVVLAAATAWGMRHLEAGRLVYATGSNAAAARLAGIDVRAVKLWVFIVAGALTGVAAIVNAVRFDQIPSNSGLGLEMKVIAAVVIGGTSISGGRGTLAGTILGVVLLGGMGPALTFLGVSAYWERALQGVIILAAVTIDATAPRRKRSKAIAAVEHV